MGSPCGIGKTQELFVSEHSRAYISSYNINNNIIYKNKSSSVDFQKLFHNLIKSSNLSPEQNQELKLFISQNSNKIKYFNIKHFTLKTMYFDMMKAKAGQANALIYTSNNSAAYNINNKVLQLAKFSICGGKGDFPNGERPDFTNANMAEPPLHGEGPTSLMGRGPNPGPVTSLMGSTGATIDNNIINNKARKIILQQGHCTDIYNKKGVLIYNNNNIHINKETGDIMAIKPSSGGAGQPRVWQKTTESTENTQ